MALHCWAAASWEQDSAEPGGGTSVQAAKVVGAAVVITGAAEVVTAAVLAGTAMQGCSGHTIYQDCCRPRNAICKQ